MAPCTVVNKVLAIHNPTQPYKQPNNKKQPKTQTKML
jgi:hypothetical protein